MDIETNEVVASGLSMPHSPRVRDGRLWLLNSGTGYWGFIEPASGKFEPVTFVPGYRAVWRFMGIGPLSIYRSRAANMHSKGCRSRKTSPTRPTGALWSVRDRLEVGRYEALVRIESSLEGLFDVTASPRLPATQNIRLHLVRLCPTIDVSARQQTATLDGSPGVERQPEDLLRSVPLGH